MWEVPGSVGSRIGQILAIADVNLHRVDVSAGVAMTLDVNLMRIPGVGCLCAPDVPASRMMGRLERGQGNADSGSNQDSGH